MQLEPLFVGTENSDLRVMEDYGLDLDNTKQKLINIFRSYDGKE